MYRRCQADRAGSHSDFHPDHPQERFDYSPLDDSAGGRAAIQHFCRSAAVTVVHLREHQRILYPPTGRILEWTIRGHTATLYTIQKQYSLQCPSTNCLREVRTCILQNSLERDV